MAMIMAVSVMMAAVTWAVVFAICDRPQWTITLGCMAVYMGFVARVKWTDAARAYDRYADDLASKREEDGL